MNTRNIVIGIIVLVLIVLAIVVARDKSGSTEKEAPSASSPSVTPAAQTVAPTSTAVLSSPETINATCKPMFDENKLKTAKVDIAGKFVVLSVKGFGEIKVQMYDKDAPKTVENFLRLANSGFYDCLTFHRVSKGFVIQGGDPSGNGTGGKSAFGGEFADELNPDAASYKSGYVKGVLAMANHGPNTNSSQFFIMLGDVAIPHAYTIFGKVVAGQDVVDKIGKVEIIPNLQMSPSGTDGSPKEPVVIEKAVISNK